eukprot:TRINITY_DN2602_c0_g5_i1.p1 TRINITY_DN2602_c0_g5~~TRINITY_DN2602_c0_g5_i1.p1  ORF type:complete len:326 (+),score=58.24 TRINITY_DN2602_c0_g5_i1:83-979(+)
MCIRDRYQRRVHGEGTKVITRSVQKPRVKVKDGGIRLRPPRAIEVLQKDTVIPIRTIPRERPPAMDILFRMCNQKQLDLLVQKQRLKNTVQKEKERSIQSLKASHESSFVTRKFRSAINTPRGAEGKPRLNVSLLFRDTKEGTSRGLSLPRLEASKLRDGQEASRLSGQSRFIDTPMSPVRSRAPSEKRLTEMVRSLDGRRISEAFKIQNGIVIKNKHMEKYPSVAGSPRGASPVEIQARERRKISLAQNDLRMLTAEKKKLRDLAVVRSMIDVKMVSQDNMVNELIDRFRDQFCIDG